MSMQKGNRLKKLVIALAIISFLAGPMTVRADGDDKAANSLERLTLAKELRAMGVTMAKYNAIKKAIEDATEKQNEAKTQFEKDAIMLKLHREISAKYGNRAAEIMEKVERLKELLNTSDYSDKEMDDFWKKAGFVLLDGKTYCTEETINTLLAFVKARQTGNLL